MMIRQECTDDYKKIGLYCNFLENKANEYEYINYIMNDEKMIDYYTMDNDETNTTFIVYFYIKEEEVDKIHNIKVAAKLKNRDEFEVGTLYLKSEAFVLDNSFNEKISDNTYTALDGIPVPKDISYLKQNISSLEVISIG